MKTEGLKKILILVTRVTNDSKKDEYTNDWKNGGFKCCELIDGVEIDHFKACSQDRTLIVLSGDDLRIGNYSGPDNDPYPVDNILKFYNDNIALLTLLHNLRKVVPLGDNDGKILVALHWNNRSLISDIGEEFQYFAKDNSLQKKIKNKRSLFFKKLFESLEWSSDSDDQKQNQFIRNLPERLKFPDNCQYTDYTIGGDRSILPRVRGMVNSLENNLAGFDEAFDDLWGGIKGSYTILHMVSILLGYLKVQLYDAGQSPQHIKNKEEIIGSIKYLCTGEKSDNILQEAEKILPRREENLKDWILSDFDWGGKANKTLEQYLANLPLYIENYKPDEFISFCSKFRNFIQNIAIGKKPEKIDVD